MRIAGERVIVQYPHGLNYRDHGVLVRIVEQQPFPEPSMTCRDIWEVLLDNGQRVTYNEFWLWKETEAAYPFTKEGGL